MRVSGIGSRAIFSLALASFTLVGLSTGACDGCSACSSDDEEAHLKALEEAWALLSEEALKEVQDDERLKRFSKFLEDFPADHPLGNPYAEAAANAIRALKEKLGNGAVGQVAPEKLLPLLAESLINMTGRGWVSSTLAYEDDALEQAFALVDAPRMQITRSRAGASVVTALSAVPLDALNALVGVDVYDASARIYQGPALKAVLDTAFVAPTTSLLGTTAADVWPFFRPMVRREARLFLLINRTIGKDGIEDRREKYIARRKKEVEKEQGAPVADEWEPDWPPFYTELADDKAFAGVKSVFGRETLSSDIGFWLRRIDDATADAIWAFLDKILLAYDPQFHADVVMGEGKKAPKGKPLPGAKTTPAGPLTETRLVGISQRGQDAEPRIAAFTADGAYLAVLDGRGGLKVVQSADGAVRFETKLADAPKTGWVQVSAAFSPDGKALAVGGAAAKGTPPPVRVLDATTGAVLQTLTGLPKDEGATQLAFTPDSGMVAAATNAGVAVWKRRDGATPKPDKKSKKAKKPAKAKGKAKSGADDGGDAPAFVLPVFAPLAMHPSRPVLAARGKAGVELYDLTSKKRLFASRLERFVRGLAFDQSGTRLALATDTKVYLDLVDRGGKLTSDREIEAEGDHIAFFGDDALLLFRGTRREAAIRAIDDGSTRALLFGAGLLALHAPSRRVVLDAETADVKLYVVPEKMPAASPAAATPPADAAPAAEAAPATEGADDDSEE